MSTPATPLHARRVSPASTPSTRNDASPVQLTPRSKVRAMLAAFSDDSEGDNSLEPRKTTKTTKTTEAAEAAGTVLKVQHTTARRVIARPSALESSDSEGSAIVTKPRGRLVGRMLAEEADSLDNNEGDSQLAYGQAKEGLLGGSKKSADVSGHISSGSPTSDCYDSDDAARLAGPVRRRLAKSREPYETQACTPPNARRPSPGLFVSPGPASNDSSPTRTKNTDKSNRAECDSDSDLPENPAANARFMALVTRKRQERLAREAEAAQKKKLAAQSRRLDPHGQDDEESSNSAAEERLTQQARPTRKASKKALEEMHRETQRIARNMQLAHEARTKKKITKQSLFKKFNYEPEQRGIESKASGDNSPAAQCSSSPAGSGTERVHSTPPTSPVSHGDQPPMSDPKTVGICGSPFKDRLVAAARSVQVGGPLTVESNAFRNSAFTTLQRKCPRPVLVTNGAEVSSGEIEDTPKLDKGKGRADELPEDSPATARTSKKTIFTQPPVRVRLPERGQADGLDSDSDLEIVRETKPRKYTVFDRRSKQGERQSNSLHTLRLLARLESPGKSNSKASSITPAELQRDLRRRARQQATQDREERLQLLRDRGIIVPTAEERARDAEEVEDLVERARREAEAIMKREKAAAKKERKGKGEVGPLGESSTDEDDWVDEEQRGSELSGSDSEDGHEEDDEDEELSGQDEDGEEEENPSAAVFLDEEASQGDESDEHGDEDEDEIGDIPAPKRRKGVPIRILFDDEDEGSLGSSAVPFARAKPNRQAIPGLPVSSAAPLGLTQMFASTMADLQMEGVERSQQEQDSLTFLRDLPAPSPPDFDPIGLEDHSQEVIRDSQVDRNETQSQNEHSLGPRIDLRYSQSQVQYDTLIDSIPVSATQVSEFPDPSQDSGFQKSSPIKRRFAPTQSSLSDVSQGPAQIATMETIGSPAVRRKGRLRRRKEVQIFSDEEGTREENEDERFEMETNAFDVMRKASKKRLVVQDNFDRAKSEAKAMVDEQAQESEDEYAGLGGASGDDESENEEEVAQMMDMIDDDGKTVVNEREIAAFYADKERASDEKQVEKLFKDITSGTLRRKRGADYDLSDSDDDLEARRRRKQREFMKMRKALLEDENIGKIATNPKKLAFLRAIEDHDQEEQFDFLDRVVEPSQDRVESQGLSDGQQADVPVSATVSTKRKRSSEFASEANDENRPPSHLRKSKRPSTLAEIRDSLSSLVAEPYAAFDNADIEDLSSDGDNTHHSPRIKRHRTTIPAIDRVALKRAESSSLSETSKLAFHDPTAGTTPSCLRVPALLRRAATSHLSLTTTTTAAAAAIVGTERMAGATTEKGGDGIGVVKRGGKASSSINFHRRERERKGGVLEGERKRKRVLREQVEGRRRAIVGLVGGGRFD